MTGAQEVPAPELDPIEAMLAAQLEAMWLEHRERILADIDRLEGLVVCAAHGFEPGDAGLATAAGIAHDLAGVCGALSRPAAGACFRQLEHGARKAMASGSAPGLPPLLALLHDARAYVTGVPAARG